MENYHNGVNCKFNYYVIAFDTQNNYQNYGREFFNLSLSQAQKQFNKIILLNPEHVNTMLGVAYVTDKQELDAYGRGAVDLLQCIDGKISISADYLKSPVLSTEGMIAVNTVKILEKSIPELQRQLDNNKVKETEASAQKTDKHSETKSLLSRLNDYEKNCNKTV